MHTSKQRLLSLDIIRSIAFFALVSIHFFLNTHLYGLSVDSGTVYLAVILRMFSTVCIPLFLMLTGYLKLNKKFDKNYYSGLIRIILIYILAMVFNYTFFHFWENRSLTHVGLVKDILAFRDSAWYIEMYIGLYLISPFLNKLYLGLSKKEEKILLASLVFTVSLPAVLNGSKFGKILPNWWSGLYPIIYYFLGCYFRKNNLKISNKKRILILIGSMTLMVLFTTVMVHGGVFDWGKWNDWENPFTVLLSCATFVACLNIGGKKTPKLCRRIIVFISSFSFVGYLVSPVIERIVYKAISERAGDFQDCFNYYIAAVLAIAIGALLISVIITKIYNLLAQKNLYLPCIFAVFCIIIAPIIVGQIDVVRSKYTFIKYQASPILGDGTTGTLFDPSCIIDEKEEKRFRCYVSKRNEGSIVLYESSDGVNFGNDYKTIIKTDSLGYYIYNRASVIKKDDIYYMYFTKQINGEMSEIYVGVSEDGISFDIKEEPVLVAELEFEAKSVMNPDVVYNDSTQEFLMYYAAGEIYEPDVIGLATSKDGIAWTKADKPVLEKNSDKNSLDCFKVGATDVHIIDGVFYMFYIGYTDMNTGRIILTKSLDGKKFDRSMYKVIVEPSQNSFDSDSVYKPSAIYDRKTNRWYLYYNGRTGSLEYIGLYTKEGQNL